MSLALKGRHFLCFGVSPLQGLHFILHVLPRASPWAVIAPPFQGSKQRRRRAAQQGVLIDPRSNVAGDSENYCLFRPVGRQLRQGLRLDVVDGAFAADGEVNPAAAAWAAAGEAYVVPPGPYQWTRHRAEHTPVGR